MRGARAAALMFAVLVGVAGCGHSRWPAKVLGDGAAINATPIDTSVDRLRALPRPAGVDSLNAPRVPAERQVYRVHAMLLHFTLANDGDIHLAIAQPGNAASTMIAEIPDPNRMTGAPYVYRAAVAQTRRKFIAAFGAPVMGTWRPAHQQVVLTGPLFFDLLHGQVGGLFGGTPTGVEIHPVLGIVILEASSLHGHTGGVAPSPPAVGRIVLPAPDCQSQCASRQAHLRRLDLLERFTFVSKGCYGTCPAYQVTFNRNGMATISNIQFVPELKRLNGQGTANIPFAKIRTLLASSQFATLASKYPLRAMDMWGVSLGWVYSDGFSYDVDGPDKNTWPNSLGSLVTAVMQLVHDTDWH